MRKYCAMDYVYLVSVKGRQGSGDPEWSQFRVEVEKPYKKPPRNKKGTIVMYIVHIQSTIFEYIFLSNANT